MEEIKSSRDSSSTVVNLSEEFLKEDFLNITHFKIQSSKINCNLQESGSDCCYNLWIITFSQTETISVHEVVILLIPEIMSAVWHFPLLTSNWQVAFTIARWIHSMECVDCSCQSFCNFKPVLIRAIRFS